MVRLLRSTVRSLWLVLLLLSALMDSLLRRPRTTYEGAVHVHGWCRRIVRAMGITYSVEGGLPAYGAVVSNHLSYLDILVFGSLRPFVMVAKREVRSWPLIGQLTAAAGTVFVVRGGGPPTWPAVNSAMAAAYRSGLPVLFFPEGTTSDGSTVLPFRRGLFHSVLNEGVPLHVAGIGFTAADHSGSVARDICWWGDSLLAPHLFRLLGLSGVKAEVRFGTEVTERDDRFVLSAAARARVLVLAQISEDVKADAEPAREAMLIEV